MLLHTKETAIIINAIKSQGWLLHVKHIIKIAYTKIFLVTLVSLFPIPSLQGQIILLKWWGILRAQRMI